MSTRKDANYFEPHVVRWLKPRSTRFHQTTEDAVRLTKVYVRFYKSFNFDYERKYADSSKPAPWELMNGAWYPYVKLGAFLLE